MTRKPIPSRSSWGDADVTCEPAGDDRVLERIDLDGDRVGFMIQGVTTITGEPFEIMLDSRGTRRMVGVEEAAADLGALPRRVHKFLQDGRIEGARKLANTWLIPSPVAVAPGSRGSVGVAGSKGWARWFADRPCGLGMRGRR